MEVFDDDVADVILVPLTPGSSALVPTADTRTLVFENGAQDDKFGIMLSRAPLAGDTVTLTLNELGGQSVLDVTTLNFNSANWNEPQVINLTGKQDTDKEARHFSRVELELTSSRETFNALTADDLARDLRDTIVGAGGLYDLSLIHI